MAMTYSGYAPTSLLLPSRGQDTPCAQEVLDRGAECEDDPEPEQHERPQRAFRGHEHETEGRVENPGPDLPQEAHLERIPAGDEQPVSEDEQEIASEDDDRREPRDPPGRPHCHDRGHDHQSVCERVGDLSERRLDLPATSQVAVELIRERGGGEEDPCTPRRPVTRAHEQDDDDRDGAEAEDRQGIREVLARAHGDTLASHFVSASEPFPLPGFVNAHSHTFQRALRGRGAGRDFWAWRETMLAEAERQTPELVRASYEAVYREMRSAGYTAVGEFHYLGVAEAMAAAEAAEAAGISLVLLHVAYARGGLPRFRQDSVSAYLDEVEALRLRGVPIGVAPHSVRACPADWLEEIGRYSERESLPLHIHADEQPKEIEECLAEHGCRPIELLARVGCLSPRTTIVHATHANGPELDLLAESGATVCACPTTEADLGDGFLPVERIRVRGIRLCIGSDSNVRIDPLEELRELEGIGRRQTGRRGVFSTDELLTFGAAAGALALGLETWAAIAIDRTHISLADVADEDLLPALISGCGADVVVAP